METVRTLVAAQLLVTAFLAVLLWSLHTSLHRAEFNRWWTAAWTLSALFLAAGWVALAFPPGWSLLKGSVVLIATLFGFLVPPFLVFGAISFRSAEVMTRRVATLGIGVALVLGTLTFAASLPWSSQPLGFSIRQGVRTAVMAAALFFCAWVFFQRVRATGSFAARLTSVSCLGYALTQSVYAGAMLARVIGSTTGDPLGASRQALLASSRLLYLDVVLICGLCLGMVLLLVEAHQRSERELTESVSSRRGVAEENTALQLEIRTRREIEQRLAASEDRYRDLVENSEDLFCTHDLEGRIVSCNPAPARRLGYEVRELLTMRIPDLLAPEARPEFDAYLEAIQRDGVAQGFMKVLTRAGERRVWEFRNTLRTEGVATPIVRGMAHDITEQRRAERALRSSEEKFAIAFRSSPCAMAIISLPIGSFLDVNAAFESITGYEREELLNRTSLDTGLWSDPSDREVLSGVLREGRGLTAREMRVRHVSGREATVVFSVEVVRVGGTQCALLVGLDTTARKDAESRQRAILKALPDLVFLTDASGSYVEFHGSERDLLVPPSDFIGRKFADVLPPELATRVEDHHHEARGTDQPVTMEYSLRLGDEDRDFEVRSVRSDRDHVLSLVRDVTDRNRAAQRARELRDELAHAGRVMALGALNGSLAHEVNQPLAAIVTNAHVASRLLDREPPGVGDVRELLDEIVTDSRRIDEVLRRLRLLLRKDRRDFAPVDVNAIVTDVLKLVNSSFIEREISTDVVLEPNLVRVIGDRIQLQQVVLNLLMNASDAVSTANRNDRHVSITTAFVDGQVIVTVTDQGDTVPDAAFAKMFEPFYTTKQDGMGLGLSICRAIMEAHGGKIFARRNAGRGLACWFSLDGVESHADAALPVVSVDRVMETQAT